VYQTIAFPSFEVEKQRSPSRFIRTRVIGRVCALSWIGFIFKNIIQNSRLKKENETNPA
jgi:hypothetical protein